MIFWIDTNVGFQHLFFNVYLGCSWVSRFFPQVKRPHALVSFKGIWQLHLSYITVFLFSLYFKYLYHIIFVITCCWRHSFTMWHFATRLLVRSLLFFKISMYPLTHKLFFVRPVVTDKVQLLFSESHTPQVHLMSVVVKLLASKDE